jgi:hypothetical protein
MRADHKVIVFAPFVHALNGIARGYEMNISTMQQFRAQRVRVIVMISFASFKNTTSIEYSWRIRNVWLTDITLTAADTIIWFAPTTSLEIFEQANARITRVGQKHKQLVLMFQSTDAEKKMYTRLRAKQKVQNLLLDMFAEQSHE